MGRRAYSWPPGQTFIYEFTAEPFGCHHYHCHALPLKRHILLPLLAGTPLAVWLTRYTGWLYGGLALIFLLSLALALRWSRQPSAQHCAPKSLAGEKPVKAARVPETSEQVVV